MPIYEITTKGQEAKRLVKATSSSAAISHCAKGLFSTRTINNVEEASDLFTAGVKMETAGAPEPEPQPEPQAEDDEVEQVEDEPQGNQGSGKPPTKSQHKD